MVERWYAPAEPLGWHKLDSAETRRGNALRARNGDAFAAYHALDALAKVTRDPETRAKARADATYFLNMHKKRKRAGIK